MPKTFNPVTEQREQLEQLRDKALNLRFKVNYVTRFHQDLDDVRDCE